MSVVKIAVDKTAFTFDKLYSYLVPDYLESKIAVGKRVLVSFGYDTTKRQGMIFEILPEPEEDTIKLKAISSVIDDQPVLSKDLLDLSRLLSKTCFCSLFDSVKAMLPPGLGYSVEKRYFYLDDDGVTDKTEQKILDYLKKKKKGATQSEILSKLFLAATEPFEKLTAEGHLSEREVSKRKVGDETVKMARLSQGPLPKRKLSEKQLAVLKFLEETEEQSYKEIEYYTGVSKSTLDTMEKNGMLETFEAESFRRPYQSEIEHRDIKELVLSEEQQKAYEGICAICERKKAETALLYGVTGSGKTQVFLKLIENCLKKKKQVILMVPEIGLTPQMLGKFMSYFGDKVAVIHSALSQGERIDEWKRIQSGKASIVIGTRSAVFAPVKNPGLIILDEEQETSYKSDRSPRFDARDAATARAKSFQIPVLLASATPSIETYYKALSGKYKLFTMEKRYGGASLPDSVIVDMNEEIKSGNIGIFSEALADEIRYNLEHDEQTILLMNRRGYNTVLRCARCGEVISCPRCSIPLTYHSANGRLLCHYCGYSTTPPETCKTCGSKYIMYQGCGTQKVEDELKNLFPDARVLRMDLDTTMAKYSHDRAFADFAEGKYDIMVGTQMVAKGLDFPNVTLVGVLASDMNLYSGDYKSYERTFSLLTQVIGRSGRSTKHGRAYIQTHSPEHSVILRACAQDYAIFYGDEIINRKVMLYPPFCKMGSVLFSGEKNQTTQKAAAMFSQILKDEIEKTKVPIRILGPTPSRVPKVADEYRYKLIVKYKPQKEFYEAVGKALTIFSKLREYKEITVTPDPYDIL